MAQAPRVVRLYTPEGDTHVTVIGIPTGDVAPDELDPNVVAEALSDVIMFMPSGAVHESEGTPPMPVRSYSAETGDVVVYDGYDGPKQARLELEQWFETKKGSAEQAVLEARAALTAAEDNKTRLLSSMLASRSNHLASTRGELV